MATNEPIKNPFASKTIWGALLMALGLIGKLVGVDVPKEEIQGVIDLLSANWETISQVIGIGMTIWGRFAANRSIGFKAVN